MDIEMVVFDSGNDPRDPGNSWYITVKGQKWLFALDRIPFRHKVRARLLTRAKREGRKQVKCRTLEVEMMVRSLDRRQHVDFLLMIRDASPAFAKAFMEEWATGALLTLTVGRQVRA